MDGMLTPEDEESLKRVRWTVIDLVVTKAATDYGELPKAASSISANAYAIAAGIADMDSSTVHSQDMVIEPHAILLKRLLKPMYHFKVNELNRLDPWDRNLPYPSADKLIFVDLTDKTLWAAVDKPKPLDDFYKDLVDAELHKDKFIGFTVDTNPSTSLVPLFELKMSLVDWWCK